MRYCGRCSDRLLSCDMILLFGGPFFCLFIFDAGDVRSVFSTHHSRALPGFGSWKALSAFRLKFFTKKNITRDSNHVLSRDCIIV